jgi:hypothetical protein
MAISEKRRRFNQAFREARNAGDSTFEFEGKKYSTKLAGEENKKPKKEESSDDNKMTKEESKAALERMSKPETRRGTVEDIPTDGYSAPEPRESASGSELGRNVRNTLMAMGPGRLAGVGNIAAEMATAPRVQRAYNAAQAARREAEGYAPGEAMAARNLMDEAAAAGGMRRGGMVKRMASGGSVKSSSASRRGDGIAQRGKTRGRMV